jgi:histidine kinase 2/3/4 (cytokinin receptor)
MILVEQEIWDLDLSYSTTFCNQLRIMDVGVPLKLFVLANSSRTNGTAVIMKPLRASTVAAALQQAMGVGNRGNSRLISRSMFKPLIGRKILIVDDNDVNLLVAAGILKKYGAEVVRAKRGQKAIDLLSPPHQIDACFMDIQMPEMDGFEATRRIRQLELEINERIQSGEISNQVKIWHVPILAMTADVIQATHEECLRKGMDGYVSKPFEAEQLCQEVARFFQSSAPNGTL